MNRTFPTHWNIYFTVENVDATAEVVGQNGGSVFFGPMDVFEAGRMAMCQDPQGAYFALWQANQHIGCRVKGEPGAMCWNELLTTDRAAGIEFYIKVLGLECGLVVQPIDYAMLRAGGTEVCGMLQITPEMGEFPPFWSVYFGVADLNATLEQAQSLGASVHVPPTDIIPFEGQPPTGRFAFLADPQGAAFGIMPRPPAGVGAFAVCSATPLPIWRQNEGAAPMTAPSPRPMPLRTARQPSPSIALARAASGLGMGDGQDAVLAGRGDRIGVDALGQTQRAVDRAEAPAAVAVAAFLLRFRLAPNGEGPALELDLDVGRREARHGGAHHVGGVGLVDVEAVGREAPVGRTPANRRTTPAARRRGGRNDAAGTAIRVRTGSIESGCS